MYHYLHLIFLLVVSATVTGIQMQRTLRGAREVSAGEVTKTVEQVDSGLYSRQVLVLGITGQIAVRGAHVLVVGNSTLGSEVVKNLALAGVGKLTIVGSNIVDARGTICGTDGTLHCFAKALNSGIEVCCSGVLTVQVYSHYLVLVMLSSSRSIFWPGERWAVHS
jgi:hypothetical protein